MNNENITGRYSAEQLRLHSAHWASSGHDATAAMLLQAAAAEDILAQASEPIAEIIQFEYDYGSTKRGITFNVSLDTLPVGSSLYAAQPVEAVGDEAALEDLRTQAGSMLTWLETLGRGRELRPDADTHAFHPDPDKTKFRKAGIASAKANANAFIPTLRKLFRLVCDVQRSPRTVAALAHPRPTVPDEKFFAVLRERVEHFERIGKVGGQYIDGRRHEARLILDCCNEAMLAAAPAPGKGGEA